MRLFLRSLLGSHERAILTLTTHWGGHFLRISASGPLHSLASMGFLPFLHPKYAHIKHRALSLQRIGTIMAHLSVKKYGNAWILVLFVHTDHLSNAEKISVLSVSHFPAWKLGSAHELLLIQNLTNTVRTSTIEEQAEGSVLRNAAFPFSQLFSFLKQSIFLSLYNHSMKADGWCKKSSVKTEQMYQKAVLTGKEENIKEKWVYTSKMKKWSGNEKKYIKVPAKMM